MKRFPPFDSIKSLCPVTGEVKDSSPPCYVLRPDRRGWRVVNTTTGRAIARNLPLFAARAFRSHLTAGADA
jgi:hypothetical protein